MEPTPTPRGRHALRWVLGVGLVFVVVVGMALQVARGMADKRWESVVIRTHRVSRGAFQAGIEAFGKQGLIELTLTMGNYALLAFAITSFDSELPPNRTEPVLPA